MSEILEKHDLKPLNWQEGDIAMSPTHFYMIYTDPKEGLTVHWTNRVTSRSDKRHGFSSRKSAQDWIKHTHYPAKKKLYDQIAFRYGLFIGQKWLNKHTNHLIMEVAMIDDGFAYFKLHGHENVVEREPLSLKQYFEEDYLLMLDGETIEQALARCEAAA